MNQQRNAASLQNLRSPHRLQYPEPDTGHSLVPWHLWCSQGNGLCPSPEHAFTATAQCVSNLTGL